MPLIENPLPSLLSTITGPSPPTRLYLIFYSNIDAGTGKMWCPDCRDVDPTVRQRFQGANAPTGVVRWVGNKAEWKSPDNEFRKQWKIDCVPTIIRVKDGVEVSRLVDTKEILDQEKLDAFLQE
ncbi:hypothetical protein BOTBODRAFT_128360 [Botryobasidium botryosum FD-172 SS1]|uniref:Thioredoxin domain-containing protein n=1 Tax=Botryobasidium botryosum (strain FD-172 SS1) TaxID=930990 RepID=A0A067N3B5_BOTB1|nr:hypothetical protein BOTBODRAFT_128360 [Botryobasidium botryosum FD-172 SS1]